MATVTLTIDEAVLKAAENAADRLQVTREAVLSEWLSRQVPKESVSGEERVRRYDELMKRLSYVKSGGPYTRDELNER